MPSTYQPRTGDGAAGGAAAAPRAAAAPAVPGGLQPWGADDAAAPDGGEGDAQGDDATAAAAKKTYGRAKKRQLTVRRGLPATASELLSCPCRPLAWSDTVPSPVARCQVLDLTGPQGLKTVYGQFQAQLRKHFKGRGHEASDLGRLLDLYRGWHRRLYPDVPFEVFVEKCEALGAKRPLQAYLRELRAADVNMGTHLGDAAREAQRRGEEEEDGGAGFGAWATEAARAGPAPAAAADAAEPDELDQLIAMEMGGEDDDDDALLEILG